MEKNNHYRLGTSNTELKYCDKNPVGEEVVCKYTNLNTQ